MTPEKEAEILNEATNREICPQCYSIDYNPTCQWCNENRFLPREDQELD